MHARKYLHIGGVVAMGFDPTSRYLLVISHDGRGVFATATWERIARDPTPAYPEDNHGIGPIEGLRIAIVEKDYNTGRLIVTAPNGRTKLTYEEGIVQIEST